MQVSHMTLEQAQVVTQKIKNGTDTVIELIIEAWRGDAHLVLGYKTWADYARAEFPKIELTTAARRKVVAEMKAAGMSTGAAAVALGADPATVGREADKPTTRTTKSPTGRSNRSRVEAYEAVVTAHPTWESKQIEKYMELGREDVRRLRLCAEAPDEVKQYLFDGAITIPVVEAVYGNPRAEYVKDVDLLNVIHKIVHGQIPFTGTPKLRELMEVLPRVRYKLRDRWLDPDEAMTYDGLRVAMLDDEAAKAAETRAWNEKQNKPVVTDLDRMLYGSKTYAWLNQIDKRLNTVIESMEEILVSTTIIGQGGQLGMSDRFRQIGQRFIAIADHTDRLLAQASRAKASEPEPAPTPMLDDTMIITGEVV